MSFLEVMSPRQSKMEFMVLEEMNKLGLFPVTDKPFCLLETRPDQYYHGKGVAVYIDGSQVHRKRQERDDELRRLLEKRHNVKVLAYSYDRPSQKRAKQIAYAIKEYLEG